MFLDVARHFLEYLICPPHLVITLLRKVQQKIPEIGRVQDTGVEQDLDARHLLSPFLEIVKA
jgi:hypothetical protein